jgi:iron only hydrogenase large subunit-like protein
MKWKKLLRNSWINPGETMSKTFVETVKDRCRVCYTCVRECPVKAIRIENGQAEIIPERCIACGNCVTVCSQKAKEYKNSITTVKKMLEGEGRVAAIVAPSFPAEFTEFEDSDRFVAAVRAIGFDIVTEVAFGADLVAKKYKENLIKDPEKLSIIAANCPAVVNFIEHYHPDLVENLAKIVSPMIAMARVVKDFYGDDVSIVFIGPCVAKKAEVKDKEVFGDVDEAITFTELRKLFPKLEKLTLQPTPFDPPLGGRGTIFPVSRGMLQTVEISDDITTAHVVAAEGRVDFPEAVKAFESGILRDHHLELLCCQGCIMGAGMSPGSHRFERHKAVAGYAKEKMAGFDRENWQKNIDRFSKIPLTRNYNPNDQRVAVPSFKKLANILNGMGKFKKEDELDCGACGYETCREHAVAIYKGLAESEMCLPNTIEQLHNSIDELESTKAALKHSERLATMGQLAAGIAHEVNNPLGVVLLYSHLLMDEADNNSENYSDLKMIVEQADRCKNIVSGLLNFARKNDVVYRVTKIDDLINSSIKDCIIPKEIVLTYTNNWNHSTAELDSNQIVQVLTNLIKNGVEAMEGHGNIIINISGDDEELKITVEDSGPGITDEHMEKLFVPFFTTKPAGKGTGLGLSVSYGII